MFIDEATLIVQSGKGEMVFHFRYEYIPEVPDGGDGGRGGE
jgi:GTPase involved in cell partitioning and DNA repair